jgi:hypothetical protein
LPLGEIVPNVVAPPTVPLTAHVTAVFELPETTAVNCTESPARMLAAVGLTVMDVDAGVEGDDGPLGPVVLPPPQPHNARVRSSRAEGFGVRMRVRTHACTR